MVLPEDDVAPPGDVTPAATPAGDFDGSQYQYIFRGEPQVPESKEAIIEGLQLGHSYRENRTKFDQDKQDFEQQKTTYSKYAQLDEQLQQSPEFKEKLWALHNEYSQTPQQPVANQPNPEVAQLKEQFSQIQDHHADQALTGEMDALKGRHPNHDWDKDTGEGTLRQQVLRFMSDNSIMNPEHAFRAFMYPTATQTARMDGAGQATLQAQALNKQGIVSTGPGAQRPQATVGKAANYDDALKRMLSDVGAKE